MSEVLIVGAGFSGSVLARRLAEAGIACRVVDGRMHIAGNCHTERDHESGVLVHRYGPHIFHTDHAHVWEFLGRFAEFMPYVNRVKATVRGRVYSLPINLHTINQFYDRAMSPAEARAFVGTLGDDRIVAPKNFEEQALRTVGEELYRAFFEGYTVKQWGRHPTELPASILKRLPIRFSYDDNYFSHRFQGMPREGYTALVARMLEHPMIEVELGRFVRREEMAAWGHVFFTGALDGWFDYAEGRLAYRTLDFETVRADGDLQGCAVMNYPDADVGYTRVVEHKHFAPWEAHASTVAFREYSRECTPNDMPYYPVRLVGDQWLLERYVALARREVGVSFLGRLATYRYLDMDVTVAEALTAAEMAVAALRAGRRLPTFFVDPLA